jgi:hypothetical protein
MSAHGPMPDNLAIRSTVCVRVATIVRRARNEALLSRIEMKSAFVSMEASGATYSALKRLAHTISVLDTVVELQTTYLNDLKHSEKMLRSRA